MIKLRETAISIGVDIDIDNTQYAVTNREAQEEIDSINAMLDRLKTADQFFREYPDSLSTKNTDEMKTELLNKVNGWRKNRTKIYKQDEASAAAKEFEKYVNQWLKNFAAETKKETTDKVIGIRKDFEAEYLKTKYDDYRTSTLDVAIPDMEMIEPFAPALLEMKEERYVEAKEDLFGIFFKQRQAEDKEMVLETTYEYNEWRAHVAKLVNDAVDKYVTMLGNIFKRYCEAMKEKYQGHIGRAVVQELSKKQDAESHMSEDAKKLQADNDWLHQFNEQRLAIERR